MSFEHKLRAGDTITNDQLTTLFKCGTQGGMRRSLQTNTLVIVSDHTKPIYDDRWIDGVFHFTGMGLKGDQELDFAQNRTLAESARNGVEVYLFEVFQKGQYIFIGQVELAAVPHQEEQLDTDGISRNAWIFALRAVGDDLVGHIPESVIRSNQERNERRAQRLTKEELEKRAKYSNKRPSTRNASTTVFERN